MWIFGLFLLIPLIEIALFVTVGAWLTLWPTLAIVLATGVIGAFLVRWQGMGVLRELEKTNGATSNPFSPLAHGALILLGGFLLILPGFFTDTLGFLLMIPPLRRALISHLGSRITLGGFATGSGFGGTAREPAGGDDYIDGEFQEIHPDSTRVSPPSGWTRH